MEGEVTRDDSASPSSQSSAENEFVRAELSALTGESDDAYDELVRALHGAMERMHSASAREAQGLEGAAEDMIEALRDAGKAHWDVGMLEEAQEAYEDALRRAIDLHGDETSQEGTDAAPPDHPTVASLLHVLGNVHARSGDTSEARRWYESALAMKKKLYGKRSFHPEIGRTLNGLAMLHIASASGGGGHWKPSLRGSSAWGERDEGSDWELALRLLEEAERNYTFYKYDEHKHKPKHRATGTDATKEANSGLKYDEDGNVADVVSEGEHDEAGDFADHPDVAAINENIADLYRRVEDYDSALGRYTEALRVKALWMPGKMEPGTTGNDPKVMSLMMAAADCLAALNRNEEAAGRYEDVLGEHLMAVKARAKAAARDGTSEQERKEGDSSALGSSLSFLSDDEPASNQEGTGTALESVLRHNIATMHSRSSRHDLALEQFRLALAAKRKHAGDDHPEVAHTLNAMGATYGAMGERQSALAHFREALYVYRLQLGPGMDEDNDSDVVNVKRNINLVEKSMMKDEGDIDPLS